MTRVFVWFFLATLFPGSSLSAQEKDRPNIIFILADDLGYGDLGCYGQARIQTPQIDKLAREGMRFTDFYAGSTVCAPSRASLMSGRHTGHGYIRGNGEVPLRAQDTILPQLLKSAGYATGMAGKWGLGLQGTEGAPEKKGWDFFSGLLHHVEGHFQQGDSAWKMVNGLSRKVGLPAKTYLNEWFTEEALDFIRQHKRQPFFLYLAFTLPHAELVVPPDYMKPYLDANGQSRFAPEKPQPPGQHYGPQPFPRAAYAAMVSQMDDYVGQVMAELRKLGIDKNTLVIFASDNGTHVEGGRRKEDVVSTFQSSGPLRGVKRDLYEGGIRVPFIARWPAKVKAGTTSAIPGAFWDMMPTLSQLAGAKGDAARDGVSFLPVLEGKSIPGERALYWEFYEGGFKQAVRKGPWKAIRFYEGKNPVRTELYHLGNDIGEQHDLAASQPEILREMEALMDHTRENAEHPLFQIKP